LCTLYEKLTLISVFGRNSEPEVPWSRCGSRDFRSQSTKTWFTSTGMWI